MPLRIQDLTATGTISEANAILEISDPTQTPTSRRATLTQILANVYAAITTAVTSAIGTALLKSDNLASLANAATARANLGLGSAATQASTAFDTAGTSATETTRAEAAEAAILAELATSVNNGAYNSLSAPNAGICDLSTGFMVAWGNASSSMRVAQVGPKAWQYTLSLQVNTGVTLTAGHNYIWLYGAPGNNTVADAMWTAMHTVGGFYQSCVGGLTPPAGAFTAVYAQIAAQGARNGVVSGLTAITGVFFVSPQASISPGAVDASSLNCFFQGVLIFP
jgi:hypothetical protein